MTESKLQSICYLYANNNIPITRGLLYAIPNGAYLANKTEAIKLIGTGLLPGVADMALDIPNSKYHGLKIELKLKGKKQTESQIIYQQRVTNQGYQYMVVFTLSQFLDTITDYLNIDKVIVADKDKTLYDDYI